LVLQKYKDSLDLLTQLQVKKVVVLTAFLKKNQRFYLQKSTDVSSSTIIVVSLLKLCLPNPEVT